MDFEHWGAKTSKILSALFSRSDASNAATLDASQLGILDLFSASGADKSSTSSFSAIGAPTISIASIILCFSSGQAHESTWVKPNYGVKHYAPNPSARATYISASGRAKRWLERIISDLKRPRCFCRMHPTLTWLQQRKGASQITSTVQRNWLDS